MADLNRHLLNDFQRDFPLTPTPYATMAQALGVTEEQVLDGLRTLTEAGMVSRVGPVFRPGRIGASTLVAMAVPAERLDEVAALVSDYHEVNHNYEREHRFNLWFVVAAASEEQLRAVLQDIERRTGLKTLALPLLTEYHIDLGFNLTWE
ncbi:MAG: AsnC family transcriptional regulator [Gammaproteobacteria bacterium RBG_16_57_12]|nr:MAG: AsnC family transcriptional regulator [Gammaproteobacteria bacterium RBG_16_57_12]